MNSTQPDRTRRRRDSRPRQSYVSVNQQPDSPTEDDQASSSNMSECLSSSGSYGPKSTFTESSDEGEILFSSIAKHCSSESSKENTQAGPCIYIPNKDPPIARRKRAQDLLPGHIIYEIVDLNDQIILRKITCPFRKFKKQSYAIATYKIDPLIVEYTSHALGNSLENNYGGCAEVWQRVAENNVLIYYAGSKYIEFAIKDYESSIFTDRLESPAHRTSFYWVPDDDDGEYKQPEDKTFIKDIACEGDHLYLVLCDGGYIDRVGSH